MDLVAHTEEIRKGKLHFLCVKAKSIYLSRSQKVIVDFDLVLTFFSYIFLKINRTTRC